MKTPPRTWMVGPCVIDTKLDDSEDIVEVAAEKVGFEKVGVGVSLCMMDVEAVSNAENPSLVV